MNSQVIIEHIMSARIGPAAALLAGYRVQRRGRVCGVGGQAAAH